MTNIPMMSQIPLYNRKSVVFQYDEENQTVTVITFSRYPIGDRTETYETSTLVDYKDKTPIETVRLINKAIVDNDATTMIESYDWVKSRQNN